MTSRHSAAFRLQKKTSLKEYRLKKHTKIYLDALGYSITDFIPSELSGKKAVDIHHIDCKGMGGDPNGNKDRIENLQALTRQEHIFYGDKRQHKAFLYKRHKDFLERNGVPFDFEYINSKILMYESH